MNIVVLTGAGVSQESGIPTFRGADGLWNGHRIEEVASPEAFRRTPELVHRFYNQRRRQLLGADVRPNAAHLALADFERRWEGGFLLVTQNVDDLHERAGSRNLLHMHGELLKSRCLKTGRVQECREDLTVNGSLRPHIVWFGEMPLGMERIAEALGRCDLFLAIGTSGVVYPAAGFVAQTPARCRRVELNMEGTPVSPLFEEHHRGPASRIVPEFLKTLLALAIIVLGWGGGEARAQGLLQSIWSCQIPCTSPRSIDPIGYVQVAYCATTVLSLKMLATLNPLCREKTGRADAIAARSSSTDVALCLSSSNPCPKEGITRAGFQCSYRCPSEDKVIRKFTACASTGDEAWSHAREICKDAVRPDNTFQASATTCTAEGQTTCD